MVCNYQKNLYIRKFLNIYYNDVTIKMEMSTYSDVSIYINQ